MTNSKSHFLKAPTSSFFNGQSYFCFQQKKKKLDSLNLNNEKYFTMWESSFREIFYTRQPFKICKWAKGEWISWLFVSNHLNIKQSKIFFYAVSYYLRSTWTKVHYLMSRGRKRPRRDNEGKVEWVFKYSESICNAFIIKIFFRNRKLE